MQAVEPTSRVIRASIAGDDDFQGRGDSTVVGGDFRDHPGDAVLLVRARKSRKKTLIGGLTSNPETLASQIVGGYVRVWIGETWVFPDLE